MQAIVLLARQERKPNARAIPDQITAAWRAYHHTGADVALTTRSHQRGSLRLADAWQALQQCVAGSEACLFASVTVLITTEELLSEARERSATHRASPQ